MTTENLFINDGGLNIVDIIYLKVEESTYHRQTIETVCEVLPKFDIVTPFALIVKAVDTIDTGTLNIQINESNNELFTS